MDPRFEADARLAGTRVPGQIHGGGRGKVRREKIFTAIIFVHVFSLL